MCLNMFKEQLFCALIYTDTKNPWYSTLYCEFHFFYEWTVWFHPCLEHHRNHRALVLISVCACCYKMTSWHSDLPSRSGRPMMSPVCSRVAQHGLIWHRWLSSPPFKKPRPLSLVPLHAADNCSRSPEQAIPHSEVQNERKNQKERKKAEES